MSPCLLFLWPCVGFSLSNQSKLLWIMSGKLATCCFINDFSEIYTQARTHNSFTGNYIPVTALNLLPQIKNIESLHWLSHMILSYNRPLTLSLTLSGKMLQDAKKRFRWLPSRELMRQAGYPEPLSGVDCFHDSELRSYEQRTVANLCLPE